MSNYTTSATRSSLITLFHTPTSTSFRYYNNTSSHTTFLIASDTVERKLVMAPPWPHHSLKGHTTLFFFRHFTAKQSQAAATDIASCHASPSQPHASHDTLFTVNIYFSPSEVYVYTHVLRPNHCPLFSSQQSRCQPLCL
mmetsp:Transcript_5451/g.8982  ORF Transcript_5451/g.8982 Transcript_5451/m.8982 type:complete len:140 (+) Transcript_5451:106-525(+)